jgi:predicted phosphoribosyltransferase
MFVSGGRFWAKSLRGEPVMEVPFFDDRSEAGRLLARKLAGYADRPDVLVLALPRGGVPVAAEVARYLGAPFDVFLVRKLGLPGQEELAMGAIASGDTCVLNDRVLEMLEVSPETLATVVAQERRELERRERAYRGDRPPVDVRDRIVILVDDGLATGSSMRAAIAALRRCHPARIVVAVPVGAAETCAGLQSFADDVVCLRSPEPFHAVGLWYRDFRQTSDEKVRDLLHESRLPVAAAGGSRPGCFDEHVHLLSDKDGR